jgi:hypothetical protein
MVAYPRIMGIEVLRAWFDRWVGHGSVVTSDAIVPPTVLDRPLTNDEDGALRWMLWLEDFPGAEELRAQVPHVRAISGRTTELDLEVEAGQPAPVADGILPVGAFVVGADDDVIGSLSVWVKGGYLAAIEYSWFNVPMPTEFPSVDRLRLADWQT